MSFFIGRRDEAVVFGAESIAALSDIVAQLGPGAVDNIVAYLKDAPLAPSLRRYEAELIRAKGFFGDFVRPALDGEQRFRALFATLGDLPSAGYALHWKGSAAPSVPDTGTVSLRLQASGAIAARVSYDRGASSGDLVYQFDGEAALAGSLKMPFSYGSVSGKVRAGEAFQLKARFAHPAGMRTAAALAHDLDTLCGLTKLASFKDRGFRWASLALKGEVNLGAAVTVGTAWSTELASDGSTKSAAEITLGATYDVEWAHTGRFEIVLTNQADEGRVLVALVEQRETQLSDSLSLGATIKVSNIGQLLKPLLKRAEDLPAPLADLIARFDHPAEALVAQFQAHLDDVSPELAALMASSAVKTSSAACMTDLAACAEEFFAAQSARWTELLAGEATALAGQLVDSLNLDTTLKARVTALLTRILDEAAASIVGDLRTTVAGMVSDPALKAKAVAFLHGIDSRVVANAQNPDLELLLTATKTLLARYRALLAEFSAQVASIESDGLVAEIARTRSVVTGTNDVIKLTLDVAGRKADAVYRRLLLGDFRPAIEAAREAGSGVTVTGGYLEQYVRRTSTRGFKLNFLGVALSYTKLLSADIKLRTTVGGEISALDATAKTGQISVGFGVREEAMISSALSLLRAPTGVVQQGLAIRLRLVDTDKKKRHGRELLHDFVLAFATAGLVRKGAEDQLAGALPGGTTGGDVDVSVQLQLSREEVSRIAARFDQHHGQHVDEEKKRVTTLAIAHTLSVMQSYPVYRDFLIGRIDSHRTLEPNDSELFSGVETRTTQRLKKLGFEGDPAEFGFATRILSDIHTRADQLVAFLEAWNDLLAEAPRLGADGEISAHDLKKLDDHNEKMIGHLRGWTQASGGFALAFGEEAVSPFALAFLKTIRELADRAQEALPVVMSWQTAGGVQRVGLV